MQMGCNLREFKEYIDNEMIVILGQMDSPTEIFEHVYLVIPSITFTLPCSRTPPPPFKSLTPSSAPFNSPFGFVQRDRNGTRPIWKSYRTAGKTVRRNGHL